MNENEMIKDIKSIIDDRCETELGQVHASSKGGKVTKTVDTSLIAKDIYNAGYRKVADDEIVVNKQAYEKFVEEFAKQEEIAHSYEQGYTELLETNHQLQDKLEKSKQVVKKDQLNETLNSVLESGKRMGYAQGRQETVKDIIDKIENLADIEIREDTACEKYFDMVLDILDKELED